MLQAIRKGIRFRLTLGLTIATFTGICLMVGKAEVKDSSVFKWIGVQPVAAQLSVPQDAWQRVYERLPNLPLENQYVSKQTGKIDENNTLIGRFMRYHIFVKRRPPTYRLDWKLTLADYLGANNYLVESQYPSADTLRENPMESDRKAMEKLTRAERDALVNVLVSLFNPNSTQQPAPSPRETPTPAPPPPTSSSPSTTPSLPKPGDAQLLMP
ncbi:hypothetical protein NDI48_30645 [Microcoleus sp. AS-A8]